MEAFGKRESFGVETLKDSLIRIYTIAQSDCILYEILIHTLFKCLTFILNMFKHIAIRNSVVGYKDI